MGNLQSIPDSFNKNTNLDTCFVCWEIIQKHNLVCCSRCNIQMHNFCYANYNKIKNYNYSICPNCQRVDTLEKELLHKHIFEKSSKNY